MRIVSGIFGGRSLKTIDSPGCRPAMSKVRGALFSMLEARGVAWNGLRVLDLFAGSGSVAFEALSRGAAEACFVEADRRVAACIAENARRFGLASDRARICQQTVEHFLKKRTQPPYDVIFADPPYRMRQLPPALRAIVRGDWLKEGGMLAAEVEQELEPPHNDGLELLLDRTYGQTRILIWTRTTDTSPSTPALSIR